MTKKIFNSNLLWPVVDYMILPAAIFFLLYSPNYADGQLKQLEAGSHLGVISDLMHGKIPLRDSISIYGPLSDVLPYLVMKLFGATFQMLRAYFHFTSIISIIIGYFLARKALNTRAFILITTLLLMVETFSPLWSTRWGGIRSGSGLFVLLAIINSYNSPNRKLWFYAAGLASIFAFLSSIEIGAMAMFTFAAYAIFLSYTEGWPIKKSFRYFSPYAAGVATLLVPFLLYYLFEGALASYIRFTFFEFPFNHISKFAQGRVPPVIPEGLTLGNLYSWILSYDFKIYVPAAVYILTAIYLAAAMFIKKKADKQTITLFILLIYGIPLYMMAFRSIGGPQFSSSITPAIIISCIFLEQVYLSYRKTIAEGSWRSTAGMARIMLSLVIFLGSFYYMLVAANRTTGAGLNWVLLEKKKFMNYYQKEPGLVRLDLERAGNVYLPAEQTGIVTGVVNYINSHTDPEEPIFAFPDMGSYYFLTGRPNFTKFPAATLSYLNEKCRTGLIQDVQKHSPKYIIFDTKLSAIPWSIGRTEMELFPEIFQYCKENYFIEASFGSTLILRHK